MLSLSEAYEAAQDGGVWVARPDALRLLRLTGEQRIWFLQNTITTDVEDLESGRWKGSCFLDPKGRVLATFRVGVLGDEVWLDVEPPGGDGLAEWFVKYRFRTKVEIEERPARLRTILRGSGAAGVLADGPVFHDTFCTDVHGDGEIGEIPQAPPELYDVLRIQAARPAFGIDYTTRDLPLEAGLTNLVSVQKGCYVGQETIARIHFRGHVNRVVRTLAFDGDAHVGDQLEYEGQPVGKVTSVARSPAKGVIGLGMVRVEPPEGAELTTDGGPATLGPVPEGTKVKSG